MPIWSNQIPENPRGPALPIRRTPAYKPLDAIVTSSDIIGCYTHFWHGSTMPCEADHCQACQDGLPYRWHAYLTAIDYNTGLHFIFECTAMSAEAFTQYRDQHATIRGCLFRARRWNNRPNGRILIQTKMADLTNRSLPHAPDLKKCLAILWNLPAAQVFSDCINPEKRMPEVGVNHGIADTSQDVSYVRPKSSCAAEQTPQPPQNQPPKTATGGPNTPPPKPTPR